MKVKISDHSREVKVAKDMAVRAALEEIGMLAEGYAKIHLEQAPRRIDTGRLRNSITHRLRGDDAVEIGTAVEYGKYVEFGTSKMQANPFLRSAANEHMPEYRAVVKEHLRK